MYIIVYKCLNATGYIRPITITIMILKTESVHISSFDLKVNSVSGVVTGNMQIINSCLFGQQWEYHWYIAEI